MAKQGVKGCTCNQPYNFPLMGPVPQQPPAMQPPPPFRQSNPKVKSFGGSSPSVTLPSADVPQSEKQSFEDQPPEEAPIDIELERRIKNYVSPLRKFDSFAVGELRRREIAEEDFPRLKVPQLKGQHKCRVSCLLNHNVDYAVDMEQELRNIGIQETYMLDMLEKLTKAEAAVRFQGAVRAAEVAAMSAPPDLAEEAAVAGARGYSVETQEFSKKSSPGENPIEIIGYIGCTRPNDF